MRITNTVVTLIPPAVDRGEPPINMTTQLIILPGKDNSSNGYKLNPAVRQLIVWIKHSYKEIGLFGFRPSVKNRHIAKKTIKTPDVIKTILVYDDHLLGGLCDKTISIIAKNEIPPINDKTAR